tara:strand:+ start:1158 stop:1493 length:336 start_codon:yes stop_codon:yes gene_type:complete
MLLYCNCESCKKPFSLKQKANSRISLEMKFGKEIRVHCKHCAKDQMKHVNDIRAEVNNTTVIIAFGLSAMLTFFLWSRYGAISTVSAAIPFVAFTQQSKRVNSFNKIMARR